jgi:hypothetical protein
MPGMRLIAGSGRSGTTWVQDALAFANDLRPVFEPLHPAVSDIGARYAYRTLTADEEHPELERFLRDVCAGRGHAMWTRYRGRPDLLLPPLAKLRKLDAAKSLYRLWRKFLQDFPELAAAGRGKNPLVKCIRANLMLPWLSRRFGCSTVLVVRHPGAVVESQFRSGTWDPEPELERYRNDPRLHEMTCARYSSLLRRRLTRVEALATSWIIENQLVIEQASSNGVTVVFYEQLRSAPDREWQRVCRALDLPNVPAESVLARPSQQSSPDQTALSENSAVDPGWLRRLSPAQIRQVQGVLDEACFDLYAMNETGPREDIHRSRLGLPASLAR